MIRDVQESMCRIYANMASFYVRHQTLVDLGVFETLEEVPLVECSCPRKTAVSPLASLCRLAGVHHEAAA